MTAASRIIVYGWELGAHGFATRSSHFGLPLTIALYWAMLRHLALPAAPGYGYLLSTLAGK